MPLSDPEDRSLEAEHKRKVVSAGDSLYIVVYPVGRGGGKYFVGRMRHPPGAAAKQVEVQIATSSKVRVSGLSRRHVMSGTAFAHGAKTRVTTPVN